MATFVAFGEESEGIQEEMTVIDFVGKRIQVRGLARHDTTGYFLVKVALPTSFSLFPLAFRLQQFADS